jgi:hypothetical protein
MGWIAGSAWALAALMLVAGAGWAEEDCGDGCEPGLVELGSYGDGGWHAATVAHENGDISCVVYARAGDAGPERGLWLYIYPSHLRFTPEQPLDSQEFININAGDMTMPMAVSRGVGFVPLTYPMFAQAVGSASTLTLHLGVRRPVDAQEFFSWSMDGFREAFSRIAAECAFDPAPVLGED